MLTARPPSQGDGRDSRRRKALEAEEFAHRVVCTLRRADFPSFSDFNSLKKSFDNVRGTFVTDQAADHSRHPHAERRQGEGHADPVRHKAARPGRRRQAEGPRRPGRADEAGGARCGRREGQHGPRHHPHGPGPQASPGSVRAYAMRDAEVSVAYLSLVAEFAERWEPDEDAADRRQHRHHAAAQRCH